MEIKLNPNGWHRRLQIYVFSDPPMFHNFCPYFWLTNFCILFTFIIPLVPIIKILWSICKGIGWVFDAGATWFEESICKPMFEAGVRKMNNDDILKSWYFNTYDFARNDMAAELDQWQEEFSNEYSRVYGTKKQKLQTEKFEAWKKVTPKWQELLDKYKAEKKARREKYLADLEANKEQVAQEARLAVIKADEAKKRKAAIFTAIVKYTKYIFWVLIVAVGIGLIWCLYTASCAIWHFIQDHYYPERFMHQLKVVGIIVGCIVGAVGIIYILVKIVGKISCVCLGCSERKNWIVKMLEKMGDGIYNTCCAIGKFFSFFWDYIITVKKEYCPGITWEENKKD